MFRSEHQRLKVERMSQDEVRVTCKDCDFKHAIPLKINGRYDGTGHTMSGDELKALHPMQSIFNTPPPSRGKGF